MASVTVLCRGPWVDVFVPMSCGWPFVSSCKEGILKEIKTLQPFNLCSSTKNDHQGCAVASGAPGSFSLWILKETKTLQPFNLCSSTKNDHLGCAVASGAPGNFSPLSNKRISFVHLKLTRLSRVDLILLRAWLQKMIAITWIFQPVWPGWKS